MTRFQIALVLFGIFVATRCLPLKDALSKCNIDPKDLNVEELKELVKLAEQNTPNKTTEKEDKPKAPEEEHPKEDSINITQSGEEATSAKPVEEPSEERRNLPEETTPVISTSEPNKEETKQIISTTTPIPERKSLREDSKEETPTTVPAEERRTTERVEEVQQNTSEPPTSEETKPVSPVARLHIPEDAGIKEEKQSSSSQVKEETTTPISTTVSPEDSKTEEPKKKHSKEDTSSSSEDASSEEVSPFTEKMIKKYRNQPKSLPVESMILDILKLLSEIETNRSKCNKRYRNKAVILEPSTTIILRKKSRKTEKKSQENV